MNTEKSGKPGPGSGATRRLAEHIAAVGYADLSPAVVHAFKRVLQDHFACAISGAAMPVSRALLDYFRETDLARVASVVGTPVRLSAQNAAFVNGANTHALDFDDGHTNASAHPSGAILPAALAIAEQYSLSARDLIAAVVLGYDVMCRIASAGHPATARRGWHNTAIAGVFGAAAAVSRLLGLDADHVHNALGLAGSFSGGTREYLYDGAEVKRLHPGKAARDGLVCAELAKRGITGPVKILEGEHGFARTHAAGEFKWERLLDGLGQNFEIGKSYFKPYPCCRHYHTAIDGIRELQAEYGFRAADVAAVEIGLYAVGVTGHDHKEAASLLAAQMSAPVAAALALVDGDLAAQAFLPASLARPQVRRLIGAATTYVDDECERRYPATRSGFVRVMLNGGAAYERRIVDPRGEGGNPLSDEDLRRKFVVNCEPLIGSARCEEIMSLIWDFENARDLGRLF